MPWFETTFGAGDSRPADHTHNHAEHMGKDYVTHGSLEKAIARQRTSHAAPVPRGRTLPIFGSMLTINGTVGFRVPGGKAYTWSTAFQANTVWSLDKANAELYANTFQRSSIPFSPPGKDSMSGPRQNKYAIIADLAVELGLFYGEGSIEGFRQPGNSATVSWSLGKYGSFNLVGMTSKPASSSSFRGAALLYRTPSGALSRPGSLSASLARTSIDLANDPHRYDLRYDVHLREAYSNAYGEAWVGSARGY